MNRLRPRERDEVSKLTKPSSSRGRLELQSPGGPGPELFLLHCLTLFCCAAPDRGLLMLTSFIELHKVEAGSLGPKVFVAGGLMQWWSPILLSASWGQP